MRTHYCGQVDEGQIGEEISVCGWVHRRRDHGGVIFVDLRDREGLLQVVFDPDRAEIFAEAERIRGEYVLAVKGKVRQRPEGTINPNMKTGQVEVLAHELITLNDSETPPFHHDENANEELRLKYRYLDLRREEMLGNLRLRHAVTRAMRNFLDSSGFIDVETPMLTRATPEGARDYIVPSRTHPGKFFALPQSPQIFKQLLMMSGLDRYYQIVRCFRDEDLRADRQPEFTQLDIEMSFVDEEDVMGAMEQLVRTLFREVMDIELPAPFPRMSHADAMHRFGSDKPDLRIPLELIEVADLMASVEFKVFAGPAPDPEGRVAALCLPGGNELSRKQIDDYTAYVARYGARGLAYIKVNDVTAGRDGLQSPILKFLPDDVVAAINPQDLAICDPNFVLQYFRLSADKRLLFGARMNYFGDDPKVIERHHKPLMLRLYPQLKGIRIDYAWGGTIGVPLNRVPQMGRVAQNVFYSQGYSGHGVNVTHLAGEIMADAVAGTMERFDVFASIKPTRFPGAHTFRKPLVALGVLYYQLRDKL